MWGLISALALFFVFSNQVWAAPTVIISELMWDGTEYIELFNTTSSDVSLSGWQLTRQQAGSSEKTIVTFDDADVIGAGEYFLVEKKEEATTVAADEIASGLTLVNTGEAVRLKDSAGNTVDSVNQLRAWFAGKDTGVGEAMERSDATADGELAESWHTSTGSVGERVGTPGQANTVKPLNAAPQAVVSALSDEAAVNELLTFSAEDSSDPNGDVLTYQWDFGDGTSPPAGGGSVVTHAYTSGGTKAVTVTVSDGALSAAASLQVTVSTPVYSNEVIINEFLPDPVGSDTDNEFIELLNSGGSSVDLSGWKLDDADGGSSPFSIASGTVVSAGGYASFTRTVTKLALNNDGDSVRLLSPDGGVKASTSYDDSSEGLSWNRTDSGGYQESTTLTAGAKNVVTAPVVATEAKEGETTPTPKVSTSEQAAAKGKVAGTSVKTVALQAIRNEEEGTIVTVEGVVSAPPGVLGKGILYLAGSGIQVYFSEDEYPELAVGDKVKLTGELASYLGETRIKLAALTDMATSGKAEEPLPHQVKTGEVGEEVEGFLIVIVGKVTETSGDTFYVDDGSGPVKVFIKESTGIEKPKMKKGSVVTITGVVSQTNSGYRILPRFQEDVRLGAVAGLKTFPGTGVRGGFARQSGLLDASDILLFTVVVLWLSVAIGRDSVKFYEHRGAGRR